MRPQSFFTWTLILPVLVGMAGFVASPLEGVTFVMSFAAIPYLAVAVLLALLLHRATTLKHLIWLSLLAPILMSVLMVAFLLVIDPPELRSLSRSAQLASSVVPGSAAIACGYVILAWLLFVTARRLRLVQAIEPTKESPE